MLSGTLNQTMRVALAGNHLLPIDDYFEWMRIVTHVAHRYDDLARGPNPVYLPFGGNLGLGKSINEERSGMGEHGTGMSFEKPNFVRKPVQELDHEGDTPMSGIYASNVLRGPNGKPLRAKWKSPDQIERLRREGRCFRCEQKGCNTRRCRLLPAESPRTKNRGDVRVNFSGLDPKLYEEIEEDAGDENMVSENL